MATDSGTERPLEDGWLPDTPVDDTLLRQFVHNQAELDAIVARALGGREEATADVFLADAASPVPYFNQAILARPLRGADEQVLDEVESFFAGGKHPATLLSLWPTPDLSARGWALMGHPAFVARGAAPHASVPRPGVEVRVADDAGALAVAERVAIEGYPLEAPSPASPCGPASPLRDRSGGRALGVGRHPAAELSAAPAGTSSASRRSA